MSISWGKKLGNGSFGVVYEGIVLGKPQYAVKIAETSSEAGRALLNEDRMLRYLHQDKAAATSHIIKRFHLLQVGSEKTGLVLELLGVSLRDYYRSKEVGLSLEKTRQITAQLSRALSFLDKNKVIHSDIKSGNILMSADGTSVTLADFGSSTFAETVYNPPNEGRCARAYRSPENVLEITVTTAVDVWALAAVIAEIYSNKIIFDLAKGDGAELIAYHHVRLKCSYPEDLVRKGTVSGRNKFIDGFSRKIEIVHSLFQIIQRSSFKKGEDSEQLIDLLNKMFTYDPETRATPDDILEHPFLLQEEVCASDEKSTQEQLTPYEEELFSYW